MGSGLGSVLEGWERGRGDNQGPARRQDHQHQQSPPGHHVVRLRGKKRFRAGALGSRGIWMETDGESRQTGRLRERDRERLERPGREGREIEETEMKGQDSKSETEKIKTELDRAGAKEIRRAKLDLHAEIEIHLGRGTGRGRKEREETNQNRGRLEEKEVGTTPDTDNVIKIGMQGHLGGSVS